MSRHPTEKPAWKAEWKPLVEAICKHCGLLIHGNKPHSWLHSEGPQHGKHRCALEPYGYDAAPEDEACSFACRGYEGGRS